MLLRRARVTQGFETATCTPSTAPGTHRGPREVDYGQAAQVPRDVLELVHHRSPYQRGVKGVMELDRGSAHTRWSKLGVGRNSMHPCRALLSTEEPHGSSGRTRASAKTQVTLNTHASSTSSPVVRASSTCARASSRISIASRMLEAFTARLAYILVTCRAAYHQGG